MIHVAVRVREIVSSNVDSMAKKASDPRKMLRLLLTEIEESLIGLHSDALKTRREHERTTRKAQRTSEQAEEWTAKAKIAVDHKREDLARSALLAREDGRKQASLLEEEASKLSGAVAEMEDAIAQLETKRSDVLQQLKQLPDPSSPSNQSSADGDSKTARRMDRIDSIERRVGFGTEGAIKEAPTNIEAEIAALQLDSNIDAELSAMKKPAAKSSAKRSGKKAK